MAGGLNAPPLLRDGSSINTLGATSLLRSVSSEEDPSPLSPLLIITLIRGSILLFHGSELQPTSASPYSIVHLQ